MLMKCGHAANASTPDGQPYCARCLGIDDGAVEPGDATDAISRLAEEHPEADGDELLIRFFQAVC